VARALASAPPVGCSGRSDCAVRDGRWAIQRTHLAHRTKVIRLDLDPRYSTVPDPKRVDASHGQPSAGGSDTKPLTLVGAFHRPATHDPIILSDEVVQSETKIREGPVKPGHYLPEHVGTAHLCRHHGGPERTVLRHDLVDRIKALVIHQVYEISPDNILAVGRHVPSLSLWWLFRSLTPWLTGSGGLSRHQDAGASLSRPATYPGAGRCRDGSDDGRMLITAWERR
jgi:hypothetical protein